MKKIETLKLIPLARRKDELFKKICSIIDFSLITDYYPHVESVIEKMDITSANYSPSSLVDELGGKQLKQVLDDSGFTYDASSLPHFLRAFYRIKGTIRGLTFLLELVGIKATVFNGGIVKQEMDNNSDLGKIYAARPDLSILTDCQVLLELELDPTQFDPRLESKVLALSQTFLWACSELVGFSITIAITNSGLKISDINSEFDITIEENCLQPFGVGRDCVSAGGAHVIGRFIVGEPGVTITGMPVFEVLNEVGVGIWDELEVPLDDDILSMSVRTDISLAAYKTGTVNNQVIPVIGGFVIGDGTLISRNITYMRDDTLNATLDIIENVEDTFVTSDEIDFELIP